MTTITPLPNRRPAVSLTLTDWQGPHTATLPLNATETESWLTSLDLATFLSHHTQADFAHWLHRLVNATDFASILEAATTLLEVYNTKAVFLSDDDDPDPIAA